MFAALSSCVLRNTVLVGPAHYLAHSPLQTRHWPTRKLATFGNSAGGRAMKPQELLYMINNIGYCTCTVLAS
jgi:hypothetical protein